MERKLIYQIPEKYVGHKISEFLHNQGYSNQNLIELKKMEKSILIYPECRLPEGLGETELLFWLSSQKDVRWEYLNYRLQGQDVLLVHIQEEKSSEKIPPVSLPFPVVYEDEDLVVVNKPANMPIHPSMKNYENTLGNAAAWYYQRQGKAFIYRCVNRLDKDTSGLTILAKHMVSGSILYGQMTKREIYREYLAIVQGIMSKGEGVVDLPLGRKPESAIMRMVDYAHGERAVTHYRVLGTCTRGQAPPEGVSILSLHLDTGRTHQIRVHMAHLGYPLIGDYLYNPGNHQMERQALHSYRLRFIHPITGVPLEFTAPLPEDMGHFFMQLRRGDNEGKGENED